MNIQALKEAAEKATPGPWDVWAETTMTKEDAISELAYQVKHTPDQDFAGAVYLLNADGKCPALTGCGPRSKENAGFIALANPSAILSLIASHQALEEALRGLLDANDNVQNVLCDGPEVPGFDPRALGRAQLGVTVAENVARTALSTLTKE